MEREELIVRRIGEINGNLRLVLALVVGWAALFWWLSLSFLMSVTFVGAAMRDSGGGVAQLWVLLVVLAIVGFVTAYITAAALLAIDRQVGEMQLLSKTIADSIGTMAAGSAERARYLRPSWPVPAILWSLGLHAGGAVLMSGVWLLLAWRQMR